MEDIICSVPWNCGDRDCEQQWHLGSYWAYDDGTYSYDEFADGNHEQSEDVPSPEEVEQEWIAYYQFCADTSTDPLAQLNVKPSWTREESWSFIFNLSVTGVVITAARHGRNPVRIGDIPKHVKQFLCFQEYYEVNALLMVALLDFTREEFAETGIEYGCWSKHHIDHVIERSEREVAKEIKRKANAALKQRGVMS
jgi:hypothetical protein